jgi:hypothetical protein
MSTATRALAQFASDVDTRRARNHRTVRAHHQIEVAYGANAALLDSPRGRFFADEIAAGDWSFSFSQANEARYLWLRAVLGPGALGDTVTITLTIRDAAGHSVASSSATIPRGFKGETHRPFVDLATDRFYDERVIDGFLDLEALDDTLTNTSWSFDFTVTATGTGYVSRIEAWSVPRFVIDDSQTGGGILPDSLGPDRAITDGDVDGFVRLLATVEAARVVQGTLLSMAWIRDTAAAIPQTTATVDGGLTNLLETGTTPVPFVVTPRRIYAASATGEAHRWRVLYRFAGGAGTETADVKTTAASNVPSSTSSILTLAYTTSWTWSAWKAGTTPTDGSDAAATLTLTATLSAAGPTLYVAGWVVEENVA